MKNNTSRLSVLILSMVFLIFFFIFNWKWAAILSCIIGISGIFSSYISRFMEYGLTHLIKVPGYLIQTVLLSGLFFLILFPISVFYRIFNKDTLMLSSKHTSLFVDIERNFKKESLEKPW